MELWDMRLRDVMETVFFYLLQVIGQAYCYTILENMDIIGVLHHMDTTAMHTRFSYIVLLIIMNYIIRLHIVIMMNGVAIVTEG